MTPTQYESMELARKAGFGEFFVKHNSFKLKQLAALAFAAGQASKVPEALRHAAKVVELFDDATWANCYMIDSADCAMILEGLAEYYESTAAPSQETGE